MLRINIICIGKIKEKYFSDAVAEYSKRLTAFCKLSICELTDEKLRSGSKSDIVSVVNAEGKRILSKLSASGLTVAMCIEGRMMSSEELSSFIGSAALSGKSTIDFIIGGSCGLSDEVKRRADVLLSMSRLTFTHQMARVMLIEQIYRAFEILGNGKYHK